MTDEIKDFEFLQELYSMVGRDDTEPINRAIYVTPYPDAHGGGGVVVTVSGTPPRATVLVPLNGGSRIYSGWGDAKAIDFGSDEYNHVMRFLTRHKLIANGKYKGSVFPPNT